MHIKIFISACLFFSTFSCVINKGQASKNVFYTKKGRFWLNASLYSGNFFDDDQYRLVDYQSFASKDFLGIDGQRLKTPKEQMVIPKGTLVDLMDIVYPSQKTDFLRPLYSPRKDVWVFLRVARERGDVNIFYDKAHILVLPFNMNNIQKVLDEIFIKNDPNAWLLTQRKHIQEAIFTKKPLVGMDQEQLFSALGPANKKKSTINSEEEEEVWEYRDMVIFFSKGLVTKIAKP